MTTSQDLRRLALAQPEAYEDLHRRRPAFRVNRKIFALLGVTGNPALFAGLADEAVAVLKLDREDQLNMTAAFEGVVRPTEFYGHHGWTYVRLEPLDEPALALLVRLAWTCVAPVRLVR